MNKVQLSNSEQRHTINHIISGAVATGIVAGTMNYKKVKNDEMKKKEAIKDTVKVTTQGAIATGAAITTANYLAQKGGLLKALSAASIGVMGVYAVEIIEDKLNNKYLCNTNEEDNKNAK